MVTIPHQDKVSEDQESLKPVRGELILNAWRIDNAIARRASGKSVTAVTGLVNTNALQIPSAASRRSQLQNPKHTGSNLPNGNKMAGAETR
jgi:hypothetical protein